MKKQANSQAQYPSFRKIFFRALARKKIYAESDLVSLLRVKKKNRIPHKKAFLQGQKSFFCGMTKQVDLGVTKYALIACIALVLTGCDSESREPDYFSLTAVPGKAMPDVTTVIRVQRPEMAGYLDRPDFVRQQDDYQLLIDNTDNWAEPLDKMFARILAADLQQRLPNSVIATEENTTPKDLRLTVDMNIERFNQAGDSVVLKGEMIVTDKKTDAKKLLPVQETAFADGSPESVAEGMSKMVGNVATMLSQDIIPSAPGARDRSLDGK